MTTKKKADGGGRGKGKPGVEDREVSPQALQMALKLKSLRLNRVSTDPVRAATGERMTHSELAKEIGWSAASCSEWENPERPTMPGSAALTSLCDYYGVSADWLLGRTENRTGIPGAIVERSTVDRIMSARYWEEIRRDIKKLYLLFSFEPGPGSEPVSMRELAEIKMKVRDKVKQLGPIDRDLLRGPGDEWESNLIG